MFTRRITRESPWRIRQGRPYGVSRATTPYAGGAAQTQAVRLWVKAQLIASAREETLSFS